MIAATLFLNIAEDGAAPEVSGNANQDDCQDEGSDAQQQSTFLNREGALGLAVPLGQIIGGCIKQHIDLGKGKHDGCEVFEIRGERFDLLSAVSQHNWIVGLGLGGEALTALIDGSQLSSQRIANAIQRAVKLGGGGDGIALGIELAVEGIEIFGK